MQINAKLSRSKLGNMYLKTFKMCILFELNISLADIYLKEIIEHVCKKIMCKDDHHSILFNINTFERNNQGGLKTL